MAETKLVIPEVYSEMLLKELRNQTGRFAAFLDEFGIAVYEPPRLSKWQRLRMKVRHRTQDFREWLALKIAPWLYTDPWA